MSINNLDILEYYIDSKDPNDFWILHVIARKKDNPNLDRTERFIKDYYIPNLEYFKRIKAEIVTLCKTFNARAYFYPTARNYKKLSLSLLETIPRNMKSNYWDCHKLVRSLSSGEHCISGTKYWMIDVDNPVLLGMVRETVDKCQSTYPFTVVQTLPTLHGYHVITLPFNLKEYNSEISKVVPESYEIPEIHKNSPVLAYYENIGE